jgi:hypothetical protein
MDDSRQEPPHFYLDLTTGAAEEDSGRQQGSCSVGEVVPRLV